MSHKQTALIGSALAALVVNTALMPAAVMAQGSETQTITEDSLAQAILERLPDIPATRHALGRSEERPVRAREHARGILAAASENSAAWQEFATRGGWVHFSPATDLPLLISAFTYRESAFQRDIVRLDGGAHVYEIPVVREFVDGHFRRRTPAFDGGVMQVRAPSRSATECGVTDHAAGERMLHDVAFGYHVGACVLTRHIAAFIDQYADASVRRLHRGQRPDVDLRFFGVTGPRRESVQAARARELLVIERYNWGNGQHYLHPIASGYARRVLTELERFEELLREAQQEPMGG